MKKYTILALATILTAALLAGCRNPNMDTNPGNTSLPTGSTTEPTTVHRETEPMTTAPTTLPETDPTAENPTNSTEEGGNDGNVEGRFRRRMPGM